MMVLWMAWLQTFFTSQGAGKAGAGRLPISVTRRNGCEHRGLMGPPQADIWEGVGAPPRSGLVTFVPVPALPHCLA